MRKRFFTITLPSLALVAIASRPVAAEDEKVRKCDEFISKSHCYVHIDMSPVAKMTPVASVVTPQYKVRVPVQSDVMINSGGEAVTILKHASPFLACTLAATPGAPTRDLSTSVAAALTTISSFAIPATVLSPVSAASVSAASPSVASVADPITNIRAKQEDLSRREALAFRDLAALYGRLKDTLEAHWKYSFHDDEATDDDESARRAVRELDQDLAILRDSAPADLAEIQALSKDLLTKVAGLGTPLPPALANDVSTAATNADLLQASVGDFKKKIKLFADYLVDVYRRKTKWTEIVLPMTPYRQKAVTETITCKDPISGLQPFDSIIYIAYYENTPIFDISAGALMSFLPGRQVGTVSGPLAPAPTPLPSPLPTAPPAGPCTASFPAETCLGTTSSTQVQFMPAAFFEVYGSHKCPWAHNGEARHPFGYACSFGIAGGIAVNPNNGTASAEFFEGVSLGIQRVSFLVGIHNGRYQTFTNGYYYGEAVPSGTTPGTVRNWTNHIAIGVAYRIARR